MHIEYFSTDVIKRYAFYKMQKCVDKRMTLKYTVYNSIYNNSVLYNVYVYNRHSDMAQYRKVLTVECEKQMSIYKSLWVGRTGLWVRVSIWLIGGSHVGPTHEPRARHTHTQGWQRLACTAIWHLHPHITQNMTHTSGFDWSRKAV